MAVSAIKRITTAKRESIWPGKGVPFQGALDPDPVVDLHSFCH